MARMKTILVSIASGLILAAGIALAQQENPGPTLRHYGPVDPEIVAAQQSLEDAMAHLQKSRVSRASSIVRARAYIALAGTELEAVPGGLQGLQLN
jgi:hypothetical protein